MISDAERSMLIDTWDTIDLDIIESIIYFDGWVTYEECGGILIFKGIDGSIQLTEYGTNVFSSERETFSPRDITEEQSQEQIRLMQQCLADYTWPEY